MAIDPAVHLPAGSPPPPDAKKRPTAPAAAAPAPPDTALPPVLGALLAMGFATGVLLLARAALGLANVAADPRVSWAGGHESWHLVPMLLFTGLPPSLLIAGVVGAWRRKPGGRRLTVLSSGLLIAIGVLEFGYGLVTFVRTPRAPFHAAESLVQFVYSFLANNGALLLLVIGLKQPGDRPGTSRRCPECGAAAATPA